MFLPTLPSQISQNCTIFLPHFYGKFERALPGNPQSSNFSASPFHKFNICYFITPWSRDLLEILTCSQLVKNFLAFYVTRNFITAFTNSRQMFLPWTRPIQSIPPHPTSWKSILILSSHLHLVLPSGLFTTCTNNSVSLPCFSQNVQFTNQMCDTNVTWRHTECSVLPRNGTENPS